MTVRLATERVTAGIDTARGGRLESLIIDGSEVLGSLPVRDGPDWYRGIFPLAPWVGRLPGAHVKVGDIDFVVDVDGSEDAFHGVVSDVAWRVTSIGRTTVELQCSFGPSHPGGWMIPGHAVQTYSLDDRALSMTLTVSPASQAMPASIGYHPWFVSVLDGRDAVVEFSPRQRLKPDGDAFVASADMGERPWDDLFTDLEAPPTIWWPGGPHLTLESSADIWVFYERMQGAFCIEPWTSPSGGFGEDTRLLLLGDSLSLDFTISFR